MAICKLGLNTKVQAASVNVTVSDLHPLIKLGQTIPWEKISEIVIPDLEKTTKGMFFVGRKLKLRVHLAVYILQKIYDKTDRQIEWEIKDNGSYQLFCGAGILRKFSVPDHTNISKFRSRLSPETQRSLANHIVVMATKLGFADAIAMDIDSTIQEANMSYPSDVSIMKKMVIKAARIWQCLKEGISDFGDFETEVEVGKIKGLAKHYHLRAKTVSEKSKAISKLYRAYYWEIMGVIHHFTFLGSLKFELPHWIQRDIDHVVENFEKFSRDVASYICYGKREKGKIFSLHLKEVDCFNKGRLGKPLQYGRNFQLGRISGNFMIAGKSDTVRMEDRANLKTMVEEHRKLFGEGTMKSFSTDRGYFSKENFDYLTRTMMFSFNLPKPGRRKKPVTMEHWKKMNMLQDRQKGIEALIGQIKQGGQLGRSRMKSDMSTLAAGYGAVLGFNLRQLIRHQLGKKIKPMFKRSTTMECP